MFSRVHYYVTFIIISMIMAGVGKTILSKLQNQTRSPTNNGQYSKFLHPYLQTNMMFLGEALCLIIFYYIQSQNLYQQGYKEVVQKGNKEKRNYFLIAIPAVCDLLGTTLAFIGLNYIPTSLYQMLRGGKMIATAMLSHFFLKKRLKKYEILGCTITLLGICVASISGYVFPDRNGKSNDLNVMYMVALILVIVSVFLNGLQFVYEERLFNKFHIHQFEMIGMEGVWGFFIYIFISIGLTFAECPTFMEKQCLPKDGKFFIERGDYYFEQMGNNWELCLWVVLGILDIPAFNLSGVSITKHLSALSRSMVDVTKLVIIWAISLTLAFTVDPSWENTRWQAILVQIGGFIILVFGNVIYTGFFFEKEQSVQNQTVTQSPTENC